MNILALETSTVRCSAAVLRDGEVLAELEWEDSAADHQRLSRAVPDLFAAADIGAADVEAIAVDCGPGRFMGLRTAVALAIGMALPDRRPVIGIDGGSVIAWQVWRGGTAGPVAVVGDARRNRLWIARFEDGRTGPRMRTPYTSVPAQDAAGNLSPGDRVVSPDWASIGDAVSSAAGKAGAFVTAGVCKPMARTVAQLASLKMAAGESSPPTIVYLHPPV